MWRLLVLFVSNVAIRCRERLTRPSFVFVRDEHATYGAYLERYRRNE